MMPVPKRQLSQPVCLRVVPYEITQGLQKPPRLSLALHSAALGVESPHPQGAAADPGVAGRTREVEPGRSEARRRRHHHRVLLANRTYLSTGAAAARLRDGGDSETGHPLGLRGVRGHLGAVGLSRLEPGAQPAAALHRRRGRLLRSAGPLGSNHACDVRAGLLEDLAERAEVLPRCWPPLLCTCCGGILHVPGPGHHAAPILQRPKELLLVVRLELHLLQVGLPAQLILPSVQKRVCGHQHSQ